MITGYKKKKLGQPSDKSESPRAPWRAVLFSEIFFPIFMAVLFSICYMFVKSFPEIEGKENPAPLIRLAIVALGPVVWNAAVLLVLFMTSLFLGPMLDTVFPKFGSYIAFIAHALALVGTIGFFEFLVRSECAVLSAFSHLLFAVVLGALGCLARGVGSYSRHQYPACDP